MAGSCWRALWARVAGPIRQAGAHTQRQRVYEATSYRTNGPKGLRRARGGGTAAAPIATLVRFATGTRDRSGDGTRGLPQRSRSTHHREAPRHRGRALPRLQWPLARPSRARRSRGHGPIDRGGARRDHPVFAPPVRAPVSSVREADGDVQLPRLLARARRLRGQARLLARRRRGGPRARHHRGASEGGFSGRAMPRRRGTGSSTAWAVAVAAPRCSTACSAAAADRGLRPARAGATTVASTTMPEESVRGR